MDTVSHLHLCLTCIGTAVSEGICEHFRILSIRLLSAVAAVVQNQSSLLSGRGPAPRCCVCLSVRVSVPSCNVYLMFCSVISAMMCRVTYSVSCFMH